MLDGDLDRKSTYHRVVALFRGRTTTDGQPTWRHCLHVAELASQFASSTRVQGKQLGPGSRELLWHAGMLHHVLLETCLDFDELVEISNMDVARLVQWLTPDKRIPRPNRVRTWCATLRQSPPDVQLVVLGDCISQAEELLLSLEIVAESSWSSIRRRARDLSLVLAAIHWPSDGPWSQVYNWATEAAYRLGTTPYTRLRELPRKLFSGEVPGLLRKLELSTRVY